MVTVNFRCFLPSALRVPGRRGAEALLSTPRPICATRTSCCSVAGAWAGQGATAVHGQAQWQGPGQAQGRQRQTKPKSAAKADAKEGGPAKPGERLRRHLPGGRAEGWTRAVRAMRERVEQAVAAGIVSAPSEEQWAMILGRSPLTRIFAGAGSEQVDHLAAARGIHALPPESSRDG